MNFFDYYLFFTLTAVFAVLVTRAATLAARQGFIPVVFGNEDNPVRKIVNLLSFPAALYWLYEVVNTSLHLGIRLLPGIAYTVLFDHIAFDIAGCVLIAGGFLLFVLASIEMGVSWRIGIDSKRPAGLVTSGVFSFSRNPIYLFFFSMAAGVFLIAALPVFLVWIFIFVPVVHSQVLAEERFLEASFGGEYREYKKRVRRYL
ncbi:MAG: hypothetical protein A2Y33_06890 [Spirochaetes bacterium GWF1_51_8]|nr:MAG: hypothetical protein A2Y33_06890 [Spirochaetes bacterium GWF1_51_8]